MNVYHAKITKVPKSSKEIPFFFINAVIKSEFNNIIILKLSF